VCINASRLDTNGLQDFTEGQHPASNPDGVLILQVRDPCPCTAFARADPAWNCYGSPPDDPSDRQPTQIWDRDAETYTNVPIKKNVVCGAWSLLSDGNMVGSSWRAAAGVHADVGQLGAAAGCA
jgi:hypothetical protein